MRLQIRWLKLGVVTALLTALAIHLIHAAESQLNACSLIGVAQASHITGSTITARAVNTSAAGPGAASMCHYSTGQVRGSFMLQVAHLKVADVAREMASEKRRISTEMMKMLKMTPKISDVSGLGDGAFLVDSNGSLQLHIFANGNKLVLTRNGRATKKAIDEIKQLAQLALSRLKQRTR